MYVSSCGNFLEVQEVEVPVLVDVDKEILARLLAYMGQLIDGCCSAGDTQKCTHDFFN